VFRQKRRELMMLQEASSPGAIRRVEELARMQAQQRVEAESSPLVLNTPESLESQSEACVSNEKEKVMIKVQNKSGSSQSIRIYSVRIFLVSIMVDIVKEGTIYFDFYISLLPEMQLPVFIISWVHYILD